MLRGTLESLTPQPGGTLASDNVASTWSLPFQQPTHGRVSSFVRWEAQLMSLVKQLFMCNLKHGNFFNKQTCIFFPSVRHRILCSRHIISLHLFFFFKDCIYFWREEKGGRKRERNINVCLPLVCPLLGTWPVTQACALTGNRTGDPLVYRLALNPLSHSRQGLTSSLIE